MEKTDSSVTYVVKYNACTYICVCVFRYFTMHGIMDLRYCKNWVAAEAQCLRYAWEDFQRYHALITNNV